MNNQLTKQFPVFEANQILTHKHLNDLRSFLDEENRITRTHLSGTGIVCGLLVSSDTINHTITLKKGFGITSLGHLLEVPEDLVLSYYRTYMEPVEDEDKYEFKESTLPSSAVFELFVSEPEKDEIIEENPVASLSKISDISDYAVVVFLEHLKKDLRSCTGTNCDNKGKSSEYRIRVLLVDKDDLDIYESDNFLITVDNFPRLSIPRVKLNDLENAVGPDSLRTAYLNVIGDSNFGIPAIVATIPQIWTRFALPLGIALSEVRVTEAANNLTGILSSSDIQYSWDHLRTICLAWNEFADVVCEMIGSCGLEIPYHPRHLVAGLLVPQVKTKTDRYRTTFIQRGPIDAEHKLLYRAQLLFERVIILLENFKIPATTTNGIFITPSTSPADVLSMQSIPFYYPTSAIKKDLLRLWNPSKTMKGRERNQYSYWASSYDEGESVDDGFFATRYLSPFSFYPHPETFLRIEGLHGIDRDIVVKRLEKLKKDFNLNFNIEVLYLTDNPINIQLDKGVPCDHSTLGEEFLIRIAAALNGYIKLKNYILFVVDKFYKGEKPAQLNNFLNSITNMIDSLQVVNSIASFDSFDFQQNYKKLQSTFVEMLAKFDLEFKLSANFPNDSTASELVNAASSFAMDLLELFGEEKIFTSIVRTWSAWFMHIERERYARSYTRQFSSFVSRNTGIEHFSGTWRNGTFFLVCVQNRKGLEMPSEEVRELRSSEELRTDTTTVLPSNSGYTVIADFTTSSCCLDFGCTKTIDEELLLKILSNMDTLLPFSPKDDLVFTVTNQPTAIYPDLNDVALHYKAPITIEEFEETSISNFNTDQGGKIRVIRGPGIKTHFEYLSREGFTGLDKYEYTAKSTFGREERATIWIRVRERKKPEFRMSTSQTICWIKELEIAIEIDYNDYKEEEIIVTGNGVYFDEVRGQWFFRYDKTSGNPTLVAFNFAEKKAPSIPLLTTPFEISIQAIPGFIYSAMTWVDMTIGKVLKIIATDNSLATTTVNWFVEVESVRRPISFVTDHLEIPIDLLLPPSSTVDPATFTFTLVQEVFGAIGCHNEHISNVIVIPNPEFTISITSAAFIPTAVSYCQNDAPKPITFAVTPESARTSVYLSGTAGTSVYESPVGSGNWFVNPSHAAITASPVTVSIKRRSDNVVLSTIPLQITITPIVLFDRYTSKFGERTYVGLFDKTVNAINTNWNIYKNKALAFSIANKAVGVQVFDAEALTAITFDLFNQFNDSIQCGGSRSSSASFKTLANMRDTTPTIFSENFVYASAALQRTLLYTPPLIGLAALNSVRIKSNEYATNAAIYMNNPATREIPNMNALAVEAHSLLLSLDATYAKNAAIIDGASNANYADAIRSVFFNMLGLLVHRNQDLSSGEVNGKIPPFTTSVPIVIDPIGIMIQYWIERLFFKRETTTLPLIDVTHDMDILTFWIDNASAKPELQAFLIKIRAQYMSHNNNI
jgi:hypothetical protein